MDIFHPLFKVLRLGGKEEHKYGKKLSSFNEAKDLWYDIKKAKHLGLIDFHVGCPWHIASLTKDGANIDDLILEELSTH